MNYDGLSLDASDYERLAALLSRVEERTVDPAVLRSRDHDAAPDRRTRRWVAPETTETTDEPDLTPATPNAARGALVAYPWYRGERGFNSWLEFTIGPGEPALPVMQDLTRQARALLLAEGGKFRSPARDDDPGQDERLTACGFKRSHRELYLQADTSAFDAAPWRAALDRPASLGVRLTTLAAAGRSPALDAALYRLDTQLRRDTPGTEDYAATLEEFTAGLDSPYARPELFIIALAADGAPVGLTRLQGFKAGGRIDLTGVAAPLRGQGLGLALKVYALDLARREGLGRLSTENDEGNAAILRLNQKLGFKVGGGYTEFIMTPEGG